MRRLHSPKSWPQNIFDQLSQYVEKSCTTHPPLVANSASSLPRSASPLLQLRCYAVDCRPRRSVCLLCMTGVPVVDEFGTDICTSRLPSLCAWETPIYPRAGPVPSAQQAWLSWHPNDHDRARGTYPAPLARTSTLIIPAPTAARSQSWWRRRVKLWAQVGAAASVCSSSRRHVSSIGRRVGPEHDSESSTLFRDTEGGCRRLGPAWPRRLICAHFTRISFARAWCSVGTLSIYRLASDTGRSVTAREGHCESALTVRAGPYPAGTIRPPSEGSDCGDLAD
ncbi:hypothetical protein B0H21DRAFT_443745 [Amylocystis lapponica]|nr:hypothetical protein B0H21DRAFT_443745 [Amylocystis lapponica]